MLSIIEKHTRAIGLDLGSNCIKMIQLESYSGGINVLAAGEYTYPMDSSLDEDQRHELAVKGVRRLVKEGAFRGRKVVCSVPDEKLIIKTIRIPRGNQAAVEQAIWSEAARKLPFDIESAQIQYLKAGHIQQGDERFNEIIVLAIPRDVIENQIHMLGQMGLEPIAIDAGPCALFRGFERFLLRDEDQKDVSLIIDIGSATTKVIIAHGCEIALMKIIPIGAERILDAIAKDLGLSMNEAVRLRRRIERRPESDGGIVENDELADEVFIASRPVLMELVREVSLCIRYHDVTFRGFKPKILKLAGGEAYSETTRRFFGETLGLPVELGNPLRMMNTSKVDLKSNRRQPAPFWAVGTGLALRGLVRSQLVYREAI